MNMDEFQPADCFICRKHRGEVSIPGGAIYQDDLLYVGHVQLPEGKTTCYLGGSSSRRSATSRSWLT